MAVLDLVFQALADPTRRYMVERLTRGPVSVSELARPLPMSLPAVMQHLDVLAASGLVRSEKTGRVRTCHIDPAALRTAEGWITERRATWEGRLDRLGDFLAETPEVPGIDESPERGPDNSTISDARDLCHRTHLCRYTYAGVCRVADPAIKKRGFAGPDEWPPEEHELDFRVSGREVNRGGPPGGPVYVYEAL